MVQKSIQKNIAIVTLLGFLILALFGMFFATTMENNMGHIGTSPCPYEAGQSAVCPMNLFDHIESWQNALRTIPHNTLLILFNIVILTVLFFNILKLKEYFEYFKIKYYKRKQLSFFNPVFYTYLFSQGILNTKAY